MSLLAWQRAGVAVGPAVVLVHAWASDGPGDWERSGWVASLAAAGLALYVPDLPGHGESAGLAPPARGDPAAWAAQAVLEDLERMGVGAFALAGFADGGMVAGHLAVRAGERLSALVLVGCDDRRGLPPGADTAAALRDRRARVWHPAVADAVARARRDRRHDLATLAAWVERAAWPAAPRLGSVEAPVLLAVAGGDAEHRERAPRLARLFRDARVVAAPGDRRAALASDALRDEVVGFLTAALTETRHDPPPSERS